MAGSEITNYSRPGERVDSGTCGYPRLRLGGGQNADQRSPGFAFAKDKLGILGRRFARLQASESLPLWRWARELLGLYSAGQRGTHKPLTLAEIGVQVGLAARQQPYSGPWVSRALKAARDWPQPPRSPQECVGFVCAFHGHTPPAAPRKDDQPGRARRLLRQLRRAVAELLRLGWTAQDIRRWLDTELLSAVDVQEFAPPPAPALPGALPMSTEP